MTVINTLTPANPYLEPEPVKGPRRESTPPDYLPSIEHKILPETRRFFETYSRVPPSEVSKHIHIIRDKAWQIKKYPCTGLGLWLTPSISKSFAYPIILNILNSGGTFLDVGCYFGQDLRKLAFDGVPCKNLIGIDIENYWDLGYELFRDRERFQVQYINKDILSNDLSMFVMKHSIDVVSIQQLLHQWSWKDQVKAAKHLCSFTRGVGSMIVGCQLGNIKAQAQDFKETKNWWCHNEESMKRLWKEVSAETGATWECKTRLKTWEDMGYDPQEHKFLGEDARMVEFVVTRKS